jgi:hypothetical protein
VSDACLVRMGSMWRFRIISCDPPTASFQHYSLHFSSHPLELEGNERLDALDSALKPPNLLRGPGPKRSRGFESLSACTWCVRVK